MIEKLGIVKLKEKKCRWRGLGGKLGQSQPGLREEELGQGRKGRKGLGERDEGKEFVEGEEFEEVT